MKLFRFELFVFLCIDTQVGHSHRITQLHFFVKVPEFYQSNFMKVHWIIWPAVNIYGRTLTNKLDGLMV